MSKTKFIKLKTMTYLRIYVKGGIWGGWSQGGYKTGDKVDDYDKEDQDDKQEHLKDQQEVSEVEVKNKQER